jgi:DNA modification methylase
MSGSRVLAGDCLELLAGLPAASVDAIVTDPPYGIRFMGKAWDGADIERRAQTIQSKRPRPDGRRGDYSLAQAAGEYDRSPEANRAFQAWATEWAAAALRAAKPGAWLVAFGGTRTFHRLGCAVEDAGWEVRDCFGWLHGQGFPKSLDVAKALDRAAGAEPQPVTSIERDLLGEREVEAQRGTPAGERGVATYGEWDRQQRNPVLAPVTPEAARWRGWGTGLKPAWEPILLARRPLDGTVAENVRTHGTGALNVDACRIPVTGADARDVGRVITRNVRPADGWGFNGERADRTEVVKDAGRWPANVLLDETAAAELDAQAGDRPSTLTGRADPGEAHPPVSDAVSGGRIFTTPKGQGWLYADDGGPSRFFYCPKASRAEREEGLDGFEARPGVRLGQALTNGSGGLINGTGQRSPTRNPHPTVKPVALMRWLVRLIAPPGGLVLDPFCGSGSTGVACALEGFGFLGMEREAEYVGIALARIARAREQPSLWDVVDDDPAQRGLWEP